MQDELESTHKEKKEEFVLIRLQLHSLINLIKWK